MVRIGLSPFANHRSLFTPPLPLPLVFEQPLLPPEPAAVSAEGAIGADDAVTGNDDANHVCAVRSPDSAACSGITHAFCHPGIGARFTSRNGTQDFPIAELKFGANRSQRQIELDILAGEIISQLLASGL